MSKPAEDVVDAVSEFGKCRSCFLHRYSAPFSIERDELRASQDASLPADISGERQRLRQLVREP